MHIRALQENIEAIGVELVKAYILGLKTMVNPADLYSKIQQTWTAPFESKYSLRGSFSPLKRDLAST